MKGIFTLTPNIANISALICTLIFARVCSAQGISEESISLAHPLPPDILVSAGSSAPFYRNYLARLSPESYFKSSSSEPSNEDAIRVFFWTDNGYKFVREEKLVTSYPEHMIVTNNGDILTFGRYSHLEPYRDAIVVYPREGYKLILFDGDDSFLPLNPETIEPAHTSAFWIDYQSPILLSGRSGVLSFYDNTGFKISVNVSNKTIIARELEIRSHE